MILTKYDEAMEKVSLSPEARERIIGNVTDEVFKDRKKSAFRKTPLARWVTVAACCVLVCCGALAAVNSDYIRNLGGGGAVDEGVYMEDESSEKSEAFDEKEPEESGEGLEGLGAGDSGDSPEGGKTEEQKAGDPADKDSSNKTENSKENTSEEKTAQEKENKGESDGQGNGEEGSNEVGFSNNQQAGSTNKGGFSAPLKFTLPSFTVDSLDELEEAAGYSIYAPDPGKAINGKESYEITYRAMKVADDNEDKVVEASIQFALSDDVNDGSLWYRKRTIKADDTESEYKDTLSLDIGSREVTLRGENGLYYLASWEDEDYFYIFSSNIGLDEDTWTEIIKDCK